MTTTFTTPPKLMPDLEVDTKVIVWCEEDRKEKRYFSHFSSDGLINVFVGGATSWSAKSSISYTNWEIVKDNK